MNTEETLEIPENLVEEQENTVYLSGPIRKADDNGRNWRKELINDYSDQFDFYNPLSRYNPDDHDILNDPVHLDEDSDKEQILPSEYVMEDKIGIRESEFVFVGLPDIIARGTCMEAMYAFLHDTPFFVWNMDGQEESGWLFDHAEVIYEDRDAIMEYISDYE